MLRNYEALFKKLSYSKNTASLAKAIIKNMEAYRPLYNEVESRTGIPAEIIFIIHYLESNCNFKCHLHNGDPLTARTIHVPKGRPKNGEPPFSWVESATDALMDRAKPKEWNLNSACEFLERYNGLGYYKRGYQSPYIFGNTNLHQKGKFTSDGKFNPEAKTKQIGASVFICELGLFGQTSRENKS